MKVKNIFFLVLVFFSVRTYAQNFYVDPATVGALVFYANQMNSQQEKTRDSLNVLKKAQIYVGGLMTEVSKVQKKIHRGLSEIDGTFKNVMQIKDIAHYTQRCWDYTKKIGEIAKKHPEYLPVAHQSIKWTREKTIEIGTSVTDMLKGGDLNLMTAGDRHRLLFELSGKVRDLMVALAGVYVKLENISRVGFWKSINPFQGYIDTDKDIIQNIINKYKHL